MFARLPSDEFARRRGSTGSSTRYAADRVSPGAGGPSSSPVVRESGSPQVAAEPRDQAAALEACGQQVRVRVSRLSVMICHRVVVCPQVSRPPTRIAT